MNTNRIDNASFGKIIASSYTKKKVLELAQKEGEAFANNFRNNWNLCRNTKYADLEITRQGDVIIIGKTLGNRHKERGMSTLIRNVNTALKQVILGETEKVIF